MVPTGVILKPDIIVVVYHNCMSGNTYIMAGRTYSGPSTGTFKL